MDIGDIERLGLRIEKIITTEIEIREIEVVELDELLIDAELLKISASVQWRIFKNESKIEIDFSSELIRNSDRFTLIRHTCRTVFQFIDLGIFFNREKEIFDVPNELVNELNAISYAHARALLSVEIKSTVYENKFFLPIVDSSVFIRYLSHTLN